MIHTTTYQIQATVSGDYGIIQAPSDFLIVKGTGMDKDASGMCRILADIHIHGAGVWALPAVSDRPYIGISGPQSKLKVSKRSKPVES